mmetsp:Transcript_1691/g.6980  ORF Transcript_1691/g.6980 Transcript_1691/m.6980 type:complete len:227 (+) Transcript_1691:816-1496(+)
MARRLASKYSCSWCDRPRSRSASVLPRTRFRDRALIFGRNVHSESSLRSRSSLICAKTSNFSAYPSPSRSHAASGRRRDLAYREICGAPVACSSSSRSFSSAARARADPPSARLPRDRARRVGAASSPSRERAKGTSRGSDRRPRRTRRSPNTSPPRFRPRRCPRSPPRRRCGRTPRRSPRRPPRRASIHFLTSTRCAPRRTACSASARKPHSVWRARTTSRTTAR